jgi:hypothetical protein
MSKIIIGIVVLVATLFFSSLIKGEELQSDNPMLPESTEPNAEKPVYKDGQLYWMQMPVVCGTAKTVIEYIKEHKFILVYVGVGKQNGKDTGKPVYVISEFVTEDMKQSLSVVSTFTMTESCIMFRGFDLKFKNLIPQLKDKGEPTKSNQTLSITST